MCNSAVSPVSMVCQKANSEIAQSLLTRPKYLINMQLDANKNLDCLLSYLNAN